jgi:ABC-type transporter MlaC component
VPKPVWNENPPLMLVGLFEVLALTPEPVVVVLALAVENTGWKLSAVPVETVWLVEAATDWVVPAPSCAEKVPLATPLLAVAVVAVAAEARPAKPIMAMAAAAAKSFFMKI